MGPAQNQHMVKMKVPSTLLKFEQSSQKTTSSDPGRTLKSYVEQILGFKVIQILQTPPSRLCLT